ncbi:hypothetical protein GCM10022631_05000 [Deinococcus rubellus]|uniref:nitric oxide synthase oxygenase n=1 Tax=Deinococcus rubellus TaxID=1889240 RepID=UPI0028AF73CE|nr:nitric oxide synthase oxygenase [Deinococcus rubellus]
MPSPGRSLPPGHPPSAEARSFPHTFYTETQRPGLRDRLRQVLHSFDVTGIKLADHHGVSGHFVRFEAREHRAGQAVQGR